VANPNRLDHGSINDRPAVDDQLLQTNRSALVLSGVNYD
jgi:hypothetical protein